MDLRNLQKFLDQLEEINSKLLDEFMTHLTRQCASMVLSQTIKNTPVITGDLRRGWTGNTDITPTLYVAGLEVNKGNKRYSILLRNGMYYASYVEYGHRQQVGRYVPAIGKRLKAPWIQGRFMAYKGVMFVNNNFEKIGNVELERFLKKNLNV